MTEDVKQIKYIISINKEDYIFLESFVPYTKKQCQENYKHHIYPIDISNLINKFSEQPSEDTVENEEIGFVLMDFISFISSINEQNYWGKKIKIEFRKYQIDFFEYYKLFLQDIFFNYSILFHCSHNVSEIETNSLEKNSIHELLDYIEKCYSVQISRTENLKERISLILQDMENIYFNHTFEIKLLEKEVEITNTFLQQLKTQKLTSTFFYGRKCFCLAYKGEFLFAISGYDFNNKQQKYMQLECLLKNLYPNYTVTYCITNENTKSYGYIDNNKNFVKYSKYITHQNGNNPNIIKLEAQFSCCERKILSYIHEENDNCTYKLRFICKYKPCEDCSLALIDSANELLHGIKFSFFYQNRDMFRCEINSIKSYINTQINNTIIIKR